MSAGGSLPWSSASSGDAIGSAGRAQTGERLERRVTDSLVAHDWAKRERVAGADFHILALASSAGAILMVQANDLIVIFLGLEILSIGLYVLVGFDRHRAIARWTWPLWMYVSVTGVIVYFMLYQWFLHS